jgi:uncharacterized protein (DUF2126 family)
LQQQKTLANGTKNVVRTALCLEPREGKLHLFLPPVTHLENYVALVHAIEEAASELQLPVVIEGYEPPKDPRLQKLLLTPTRALSRSIFTRPATGMSWCIILKHSTSRRTRQGWVPRSLCLMAGTPVPEGEPRHPGRSTPADSPVLRRPDLLRSLVTYWQHHPGLSYLFSGMFIGPTSQAPRPDEGRDEALYEMEIAFQNMPEGLVDTPWLVDRLMRNLLVDVTGNTHRSEFASTNSMRQAAVAAAWGCWSSAASKCPLTLACRWCNCCCSAAWWRVSGKTVSPAAGPLGTQLHDKFMLPHFVWQDVKEVVDDLQRHGYPFKLAWLLPFEEFRFPHYGRQQIDDIELELRWAIEPWHVLGEEVTLSGTSRYVDSSVERIQVRLSGLTEGRYVLACNGRRGAAAGDRKTRGDGGAVRYRAWAPPSALHPTLGVNTPLVFDLIDTWNGLSIGGCTYRQPLLADETMRRDRSTAMKPKPGVSIASGIMVLPRAHWFPAGIQRAQNIL